MSHGDSRRRPHAAKTSTVTLHPSASQSPTTQVVFKQRLGSTSSSVTAFDHRVTLDDYFGNAKELKLYEVLGMFPFCPSPSDEFTKFGYKTQKRYIVLNSKDKPLLFVGHIKLSSYSPWWLRYFVFSLAGKFIMSIDRRSPPLCCCLRLFTSDPEAEAYKTADVILHPSISEMDQTAFHVRLKNGDFLGHWKLWEKQRGSEKDAFPMKHVVYDDLHFPVMRAIVVTDDQSSKAPARNYLEVFQGDYSVAKISQKPTKDPKSEIALPKTGRKGSARSSSSHVLSVSNTDFKAQFPLELHVCDKALILGLLLTELRLGS